MSLQLLQDIRIIKVGTFVTDFFCKHDLAWQETDQFFIEMFNNS